MVTRSAVLFARSSIVLSLFAIAATRAEAGAMYDVTGLGDLSARGISNAGQVIGDQPYTATNPYDGSTYTGYRSALYQNGAATPLSLPDYQPNISGAMISPGGTIAYNTGYGSGDAHVFMNGKSYDVGSANQGRLVGGGDYSIAHAVNDKGTVVGESHAYVRYNRAFMSYQDQDGRYTPL